jgi:WD40 repeat protein
MQEPLQNGELTAIASSGTVFPRELGHKVGELQRAITDLAIFLENRSMDCYFLNVLTELNKISKDVDSRLQEVEIFFKFLNVHDVSATSMGSGYFSLLPDELLIKVLSYLDEKELCTVMLVSHQWKRLAMDNSLWKRLYYKRWKDKGKSKFRTSTQIITLEMLRREQHTEGASSSSSSSPSLSSSLSRSDGITSRMKTGKEITRSSPSRSRSLSSSSNNVGVNLGSPHLEKQEIAQDSNINNYNYKKSNTSKKKKKRNKNNSNSKKDWKMSYVKRCNTEANWREGRFKCKTFAGHTSTRVRCLQFDEEKLVMGSFDQKSIRVLDFQTRKNLQELVGHTGGVMSLKFHSNLLLSASRDRTVKIWDILTGTCVNTFTEHSASVWCLDWDEGPIAVSGSEDRMVKLWDLRSGRCVHTCSGHGKGIGSITFDDFHIASGSRDKTIRIWDQRTRRPLHILKGHSNSVRCLKFDAHRLVSGSWDNTIKIWDIKEGIRIANLTGHQDRVLTLQFDDDKIVSGSFDHTIKIWNAHTGQCMRTLDGHEYPLAHVQFDQNKIISGARDLTIKIWDFS